MKVPKHAAIGLTLLATAGCASQLKPAIEDPFWFVTLSTRISAGKIDPPTPDQTVTVPGQNYILRVALAEYPGFQWQADAAQNSAMLRADAYEDPEACPTGIGTGCVYGQAQQYGILASGTTKIVFTLVATNASTKSPTPAASVSVAKDAPACPSGITAPPPAADVGCVLGTVTLTVKVG
jgi:hypothetical protein